MRKHISLTAFAALLALTMIGCVKSAVHATTAGGPPTVGLSGPSLVRAHTCPFTHSRKRTDGHHLDTSMRAKSWVSFDLR
jgi:hypothetical protein